MFIIVLIKRPPLSAPPSASVREVARVMHDNEVDSIVPVVEGKPVGVFTERGLLRLVATGLLWKLG